MLNKSLRYSLGIVLALAGLSPAMAQQQARDPLTRLLDGVFKRPAGQAAPDQPQPEQTQQAPTAPAETQRAAPTAKAASDKPAQPSEKARAKASKKTAEKKKTAAPKPQRAARQSAPAAAKPQPEPQLQHEEPSAAAAEPSKAPGRPTAQPVEEPAKVEEARKPEEPVSAQAAEPSKPEAVPAKAPERPKAARATPTQAAPAPTTVAAPAQSPTPTSPPTPSSPAAALDQVNTYFNSIDQLTASFLQKNPNGQQVGGTLAIKRPGIFQFAYAPPSTLEIVSDGRNVAIRDKKLGTNDVYPVGQTPLKFLLQENVSLGRDTKVRDVQIGRDGMVTVRFDDDATLGGTSKITLRFDSRANALRQWTIVDGQGYETSVTLSDLNVVHRKGAAAAN